MHLGVPYVWWQAIPNCGSKKLQKIACQSWKGRTLEFSSQYVIITDYTNLIS